MASSLKLSRSSILQQFRGLVRPPKNLPFRGIYRRDGDFARKGDLLVNQYKMNYHPGLNVFYENDRGEKLLRADCDGVVRITTEKVNPDWSLPEMREYEHRKDVEIHKLTFNVVPLEVSQSHTLKNEI